MTDREKIVAALAAGPLDFDEILAQVYGGSPADDFDQILVEELASDLDALQADLRIRPLGYDDFIYELVPQVPTVKVQRAWRKLTSAGWRTWSEIPPHWRKPRVSDFEMAMWRMARGVRRDQKAMRRAILGNWDGYPRSALSIFAPTHAELVVASFNESLRRGRVETAAAIAAVAEGAA